jgi:hypothetical protein
MESILERIDELIGMSNSHLAAVSSHQSQHQQQHHISPLVRIQKHKHLVELVEKRIRQDCSVEETEVIFGLVSSVDQTHSKWV